MSDLAILFGNGDDLFAKYRAMYGGMSKDQVYAAIRDALRMTVESWIKVAFGIEALERLGEDMQRIRTIASGPMLNWLRRIAGGQLRPELICRFYQRHQVVSILAKLPTADQVRLAAGELVPVLVPDGAGGYTTQMGDPSGMTPDQLRQVFDKGNGCIRDEAAQRLWLSGQAVKAALPKAEKIGVYRVDREAGLAYFEGKRGDAVDAKMLRAILRALEGK